MPLRIERPAEVKTRGTAARQDDSRVTYENQMVGCWRDSEMSPRSQILRLHIFVKASSLDCSHDLWFALNQ